MTFEKKTTKTVGNNTKPMTVIVKTDSKGYPMGEEVRDMSCVEGCENVYLKHYAYDELFEKSGYIVECTVGHEGLTWDDSENVVWHPWDEEKMVVN